MKKIFYLILLCTGLQSLAYAQNTDSTLSTRKLMSFQILAGTQGVGANFRYVLNKTVGLRLGGSYAKAGVNDKINFSDFSSSNRLSGKLANLHLLAELMPQKFFRVVAGAAYLANAEALVHFEPKDTQHFNDITITPDEIGTLDFKVETGKLAPYLGVGIGKGIPGRKFNVNLDLGTYYISAPKVTAIGTKLLSNNEPNAVIIQNNIKNYRFLPVMQLNFNFKF